MTRQYGVDVAVYQGTNMESYKSCGAKFMITKLTEGTNYTNPLARGQIRSAHAHHMYVHAYHFANFSNSVHRAKQEARFFVREAKNRGISKKRYLVLDWETGDGNSIYGSRYSNTRAILAFMHVIKKAGWKPMLYSGASCLKNNVDTCKVVKRYGTCLWVASYATMGRIDRPNFGYFPSMNGVAIWQFTDNWCGLNVDGNISLININRESKPLPIKKVVPKKYTRAYAPVINGNPNWKIRLLDKNGHYQNQYIPTNSWWKVVDVKTIKGKKMACLGTQKQWCPVKFLKLK